MNSQLSNPAQRAQHRIAGPQPVDILIDVVDDIDYTVITYVTSYFQLLALAALTASGTVNLAVKRVRDGVTTTVTGLSAVAASSTRAQTDATLDDTTLFIPGDKLYITASGNSSALALALTLTVQPMGVGG